MTPLCSVVDSRPEVPTKINRYVHGLLMNIMNTHENSFMSDGDDSYTGANLLRFHWDVNNGENNGIDQSQLSHPVEKALREVVLDEYDMDDTSSFGLGKTDDLHAIVRRINTPNLRVDKKKSGCIICDLRNLRGKNHVVQQSMGSMAQCRGARGDSLREAGAIGALLDTLWRLISALLPPLACTLAVNELSLDTSCDNHLPFRVMSTFADIILNELEMTSIDLANSCLGALRDLACGSASNRVAILEWRPSFQHQCGDSVVENGAHILSAYVKRYHQWTWEEILSLKPRVSDQDRGKKEMRLLTNALGAVRNASHSAPDVCQEFFNHGLVDSLVRRLMPHRFLSENSQTTISIEPPTPISLLPEASCPWREACFRAAGSLINLAEKCPHVARQLGSDRECILLLMETWGGAKAVKIVEPNKTDTVLTRGLPILHLGLAAILNAAENGALEGGPDPIMMQVLENERMRKRIAQRSEDERKLRQIKAIN